MPSEYVIEFITRGIRLFLTGSLSKFRFYRPEAISLPRVTKTGIYIHVPFCEQLCPYCPYNRYPHNETLELEYIKAIKKEISYYSKQLPGLVAESVYFGGGTPTILSSGLIEIINELRNDFDVVGPICIESNPADLTYEKVSMLKSNGVDCISIGIQSFNPKFLNLIGRKYPVEKIKEVLNWLGEVEFKTVNFDLMFALPGQTIQDLKEDLDIATSTFADQITMYPLFTFPYSSVGEYRKLKNVEMPKLSVRKKMYYFLSDYLIKKGYQRVSVWSFKRDIVTHRYSSVTRERYIGFGPGAGSFYGSLFTLNTFSVSDYITSVNKKGEAIALQIPFGRKLSILYDFYWRLYDTRIPKTRMVDGSNYRIIDFRALKLFLTLAKILGMVIEEEKAYILTQRGAFWIHLFQNYFFLRYVNKIWSVAKCQAWPESIEF